MSPVRVVASLLIAVWLVGSSMAVGAQDQDVLVGDSMRISTMGPDGETTSRADNPNIAYNSVNDEFLVVWFGNDGVIGGDRDRRHQEVFGQRIDAATGQEIGDDDFRISFVGEDDDLNIFVGVAVTHNPEANEYLVAWLASATTNNPPFRVRVRRVDGATGELLGEQKILTDYETLIPSFGIDVVYNPNEDEYLVVWAGTDDSPEPPIVRFEYEVYGQRIDAEANEVGSSKFRISQVMGDGRIEDANVEVFDVRVAHNPAANEYLVVFDALAYIGDSALRSDLELEQYYIDQEYELFGQRLDGQGNEIGENDFLISDEELPGPPQEPIPAEVTEEGLDDLPSRSDVLRGRVVFNPNRDEFLVVWSEDGVENGLAEREFEVFGRRIASNGSFATDKFQITDHGPPGEASFFLLDPNVVHDPDRDHYLVTYSAPDVASTPLDPDERIVDNGPILVNESEVHGAWLDGEGAVLYDEALQLSMAGAPGDGRFDAYRGSVAYSTGTGEFVVAWQGNDDGFGEAPFEFAGQTRTVYEIDIFAQRVREPPEAAPPTTTTAAPPTSNLGVDALTTTTVATTTVPQASDAEGDGGGSSGGVLVAIGLGAAAVVAGGFLYAGRRRSGSG